jgi:chromosome partitioning protein
MTNTEKKKKATVISVNCQKGGVGKTTSCLLIGYTLSKMGNKVLLIDLDAQGNLSFAARAGENIYNHTKNTTFEAIKRGTVKPFIIPAHFVAVNDNEPQDIPNLFIVPAEDWLSDLAKYLYVDWRASHPEGFAKGEYMYLLKNAIRPVLEDFDYILIDCPPTVGEPTRLSLCAADFSLIIMQSQIFCFDAVSRFAEILEGAQKNYNHDLDVVGIVPTLLDARATLDVGIVNQARDEFGEWVTDTVIRAKAKIKEFAIGIPEKMYKQERDALEQYNELTEELLKRCQML